MLLASAPSVRGHGEAATWTEGALGSVGLRIDRSALTTMAQELPLSPLRLRSSSGPTQISLIGSSVVVELGRVTRTAASSVPVSMSDCSRPRSKSWMAEIGLEAENCMAPLLRGRLRRNAQTDEVGATITVSARCTFY